MINTEPKVSLTYIHDPMCSWCWAYRPVLDDLVRSIPAQISWQNLLGGLAPDSDEPMPETTRTMVMNHWRRIEAELGTQFNHDFWSRCAPRRSTYPACRAVLAAKKFDLEEAMIDTIQKAYYLRAMNPSDEATLIQLASELGISRPGFESELHSPAIQTELLRQVNQARQWPVGGFPSLVLKQGQQVYSIPVDYRSTAPTLAAIDSVLN